MSLKTGQWTILFVHLPSGEPLAGGVLLLDTIVDSLSVRLRETIPTDDEAAAAVWSELNETLLDISKHSGGEATLAWLEDTASHFIRVCNRKEIQFSDPNLTLKELYQEHVLQTRSQAAGESW